MDRQPPSSKQQGFSLIELLVVVAIIGVLAAAGIVGYNSYLNGVKESTHKNNAIALAKGLQVAGLAKSADQKTDCDGLTVKTLQNCARAIGAAFKSPFDSKDLQYIIGSPDASACTSEKKLLVLAPTGADEGKVVACGSSETPLPEAKFGKVDPAS